MSLTSSCSARRKDPAATAALGRLREVLAREALLIRPGALHTDGYGLPQQERERLADMAVRQAQQTIENRVNAFGVAEPIIQRQGTERILRTVRSNEFQLVAAN